jgi:hypothetical protein
MSAAGANTALAALLAAYPWIKLHVGDPGAAGTANPATETTRQQVAWDAPSAGASQNDGAETWTAAVATGTEDVTHFSAWSASSGGTFGFSGTITANAFTTGTDLGLADGDLDISMTVGAA